LKGEAHANNPRENLDNWNSEFAFVEWIPSATTAHQLCRAASTASAETAMLDIVVQSPITIVQYKDGDVDLLLPSIEQHPTDLSKA